jgi:Heterokaryon incompatibility protein (HET)
VTPNLYHALQQFCGNQVANGNIKRKLWIDPACIHQADAIEKYSQVMLMKDIYTQASKVVMWLGKADDLTELAFHTLEHFTADDGTPRCKCDLSKCHGNGCGKKSSNWALYSEVAFRPCLDNPRSCCCQKRHGGVWAVLNEF